MSSTPDPSSTPPEGTPPEGTAESQPRNQSEQADSGQGAENAQPRRIPIGTQRPGVKPPRLTPRYEYFSAQAPAATAGLQSSGLAAPAPAVPAAVAAKPLEAGSQDAPAAAAPAADGAKGQNTPGQTAVGQTAAPRREGRRDKRGSSAEKSPFQNVVQQKRVAVPNLRAALDDDLEEDFEAALAGVAIDDLITASTSAAASAASAATLPAIR